MPLHSRLLRWYDSRTREMPWRNHPDPYAVWVSEIMLQQTQVETVKGYFTRFMAAFPTVAQLAAAPQQDVLKAWEGLGYYTRARNLQAAAQRITAQGGALPRASAGWAALPGIGPYTAAAIASICDGEAAPVVDGNVARVFARYLGWADDFRKLPAREKLAAWLLPHIKKSKRPGDFNQAMMDLGATCCTPRAPRCAECPLRDGCLAFRDGTQSAFPVKPAKKVLPVRRMAAALATDPEGRVLLTQRAGERLLGGLWELPSVEVTRKPAPADALRALREQTGFSAARAKLHGTITHTFSHFKLELHVYAVTGLSGTPDQKRHPHARFARAESLPLTTATRRAIGKGKETKGTQGTKRTEGKRKTPVSPKPPHS
ncbi:MAG: A/G-specific adenine glycosylase [Kiritimatiellaeota bacterium]|nr:A/G-specific adenine glycosylase [Kiritimatiellota bacterium]